MKKLLLVLAIASFAACNDAGSGDENKTDSSAMSTDSSAMAPAPAPADSTAAMPVDSTKTADTTIKK